MSPLEFQQKYGELLLTQYLQYQNEWSVKRIHTHIATQDNEVVLCGLTHKQIICGFNVDAGPLQQRFSTASPSFRCRTYPARYGRCCIIIDTSYRSLCR